MGIGGAERMGRHDLHCGVLPFDGPAYGLVVRIEMMEPVVPDRSEGVVGLARSDDVISVKGTVLRNVLLLEAHVVDHLRPYAAVSGMVDLLEEDAPEVLRHVDRPVLEVDGQQRVRISIAAAHQRGCNQ